MDPDRRRIGGAVDQPVTVFVDAQRRLGDHRIGGALGPDSKVGIGARGEADAGALPQSPIGDRRDAVSVDEGAPAKDPLIDAAGLERQAVVAPVDQVVAGDVVPAMALFGLHDHMKVVAPIPEECPIGVERRTHALGRDDVVEGSVGICEQPCAQRTSVVNLSSQVAPPAKVCDRAGT